MSIRRRREAMAEGIELFSVPDTGGRTDETVDTAEGRGEGERVSLVDKDGYPVRDVLEKEDMALPTAPPRAYLRKCDDTVDGLVPVEGVEMI